LFTRKAQAARIAEEMIVVSFARLGSSERRGPAIEGR
jgi:hypothetical protein